MTGAIGLTRTPLLTPMYKIDPTTLLWLMTSSRFWVLASYLVDNAFTLL